jgi:hypothetical protein
MRMWLLGGVATALVMLGSGVASGRATTCHAHADFNVEVTSATHITCRAAASDIRAYKGSIKARFRTPGGFTCRRVAGERLEGRWRCTKGAKAYRFEFSD